jgi:hypothetical protein
MPIGVSDVVRIVRESREAPPWPGPLLVVGPLAEQLARQLVQDGETAAVSTGGRPEHASAVICVLDGEPRPEQLATLRAAARAVVPMVGVQLREPGMRVPYILAGDIVDCRPGEGFPVDEIAGAVARVLGRDAAAVAARVPVLRPAARRRLVQESAVRGGVLAAAPWVHGAHLPILVLLQVRMLRDLAAAEGRPAPEGPQQLGLTLGPELGGALATGLVGRRASRAVAWTGPAGRAAVAFAGTAALGALGAAQRTVLARFGD